MANTDPIEMERIREQTRLTKEKSVEIKKWFKQYKSTLKCKYCSENEPCCLDFHHRKDEIKTMNIGMAIQEKVIRRPKEEIEAEIAKCDVVCANCHRKLHFKHNN